MESNPVVAALQRQQASALVLYLNYKKYHWLTFGPHFRDLHLQHGHLSAAEAEDRRVIDAAGLRVGADGDGEYGGCEEREFFHGASGC